MGGGRGERKGSDGAGGGGRVACLSTHCFSIARAVQEDNFDLMGRDFPTTVVYAGITACQIGMSVFQRTFLQIEEWFATIKPEEMDTGDPGKNGTTFFFYLFHGKKTREKW